MGVGRMETRGRSSELTGVAGAEDRGDLERLPQDWLSSESASAMRNSGAL